MGVSYSNKLLGELLTALDAFYEHIEDKDSVIRFVKGLLKNKRVAEKAGNFLKKHR